MKTLIEEYRGWEIYFDTDSENFYTVSSEYDNQKTKVSYSAVKKYIDDFIKENQNFKPVIVECPESLYGKANNITLIGIRKDGTFMYKDKHGKPKQLSKYSEKDYFLYKEENQVYFNEIKALKAKKQEIDNLIKEQEAKIIKVGLNEIRNKYIGG